MADRAGAGVLLSNGKMIPVTYDLVQTRGLTDSSTEGQVFGDVDDLRAAFMIGRCDLRLESGDLLEAVLLGCSSRGVADIRITAPKGRR